MNGGMIDLAEEKESKKVRRGNRFGRYAYNYMMFPIRRAIIVGIFRIIGLIILLALVLFLLSGGINQVLTGQTLIEYSLDIGEDVSDFLHSLTDGTSPFKFTKYGIYFKDADVPEKGALDGNEGLIDGGQDDKIGDFIDNYININGEDSDEKMDQGLEDGSKTENESSDE